MSTRRNARTAAPPSTGEESSTNKLVRMQENINQKKAAAERARQAMIEAERLAKEQELAIVEEERRLVEEMEQAQKEEQEAAKKCEEEAAAAAAAAAAVEEEEKKVEAKKKVAEGKKKKVAGSGDTKGKGRARTTDENDVGDMDEDDQPLAKGPKKKMANRTGSLVNDAGKNISNEIVQGALYPSCTACAKAEQPCQWKQSVIHFRLAGVPNKAKNCEDCVRKQVACQFVWEKDESLKRAAEEYQTSEAHKRNKFDGPDMVSCVQSIDKNIGTLVKFMVAQATQSTDNHKMTSDALGSLTDSLDGIRQKYTGK